MLLRNSTLKINLLKNKLCEVRYLNNQSLNILLL